MYREDTRRIFWLHASVARQLHHVDAVLELISRYPVENSRFEFLDRCFTNRTFFLPKCFPLIIIKHFRWTLPQKHRNRNRNRRPTRKQMNTRYQAYTGLSSQRPTRFFWQRNKKIPSMLLRTVGTTVFNNFRDQRCLLNFHIKYCLLYTSPSPRDLSTSRMPSSA